MSRVHAVPASASKFARSSRLVCWLPSPTGSCSTIIVTSDGNCAEIAFAALVSGRADGPGRLPETASDRIFRRRLSGDVSRARATSPNR